MTKIAASVSMDVDMAQELKHLATERGQSFSALIIELIEAGQATEGGLFSSTETVERALREPSAMGPVAEIVAPAEQSSDRMSSASQQEPADRRQPDSVRRLRSPESDNWPDQDEIENLGYEERVIACITDEPRSAVEIADFLDMPVAPVMNLLDAALETGTISGRRVGGSWRFWHES